MLTSDMKRVIMEQRLGFVATTNADGTPNLSPKATFAVIDDQTIGFGDVRSPGTMRNLAINPNVEVNFVDAFVRTGYRFKGTAVVVTKASPEFEALAPHFAAYGDLVMHMRAFVVITVMRALPVRSPAYDRGATEPELRRLWTQRFRTIQPNGRFVE